MATHPIHPPHCMLGVIGGGQLGRMLALAARRMNVRTAVWTGGLEAPAVEVADEVIDLPFDDPQALVHFCEVSTVATVEFENIPHATLVGVAERLPLHPSPAAVEICQNREREKNFLRRHDIPCTEFWVVSSADELAAARPDRDPPVIFLCRSGVRSRAAAIAMTARGFTRAYNLAGGFEGAHDAARHRGQVEGWKVAGLPWTQD